MITIRTTPSVSQIVARLPPEVSMEIRKACSYHQPGSEFSKLAKKRDKDGNLVWDGLTSLYNRSTRKFPTGLLFRVISVFEECGLEYRLENMGESTVEHSFRLREEIHLRDYQQASIEDCVRRKRCMVKVATGGGKTVIAGGIIARVGRQTLFLVHTKDLLAQAIDMFTEMFGGGVGQIGDGVVDLQPVTVATIQTLSRVVGSKYRSGDEDDTWTDSETRVTAVTKVRILQWLRAVGLVFMDECHRVAAPTAVEVVSSAANAPYRFGLSASPWRDDGADIVLEGVFGDVGPVVNATDLIEMGFLVQPVIRMLPVPPEIFERKTSYERVYSEYVVENDVRNAMGVRAAVSMVNRGRPTLVLVRRLSHGADIARSLTRQLGFDVPFLSGTDDSLVRKQALDDIREERLGCLVASTIADEGLDVKPLSGLVLLGGGKSSTRALQRVGRVLRPWQGKKNAEVVDFNDQAMYLGKHSIERERIYSSEPRFIVTDI